MVGRAIGADHPMKDAVARVTGTISFTVDHQVEGLAHARVVRSTEPHAVITSVDVAEALDQPGVVAVITGKDVVDGVANPYFGVTRRDQPPLAIDKVCYVGEPVALVVAETEEQARAAAEQVWVEYEELPFVTDPEEASAPTAPAIHEDWPDNGCGRWRLERGDVGAAFEEADRVYDAVYSSPAASPQPLEPHVAVARWEDDRLEIWSATQWPSAVRRELAHMFALPEEQIRSRAYPLGGGFGAKGQVKIEPLVACGARLAGRPVRLELDRDEVFYTVCKHAAVMRYRTGVKADGTLLVRDITLVYNAGAYAITSPSASGQALVRSPGPYRIPNVRVESVARYTNTVPAGSFRGAMTNQVAFAYESQMDEIAADLGIDPVELRRRNLLHDGDAYATGEEMHDVHFHTLVGEVADAIGWDDEPTPAAPGRVRGKGVGVILKSTPTPSRSEAGVEVRADGRITVYSSAVDMGQGASATIAQLAADVLDVPYDNVDVVDPDTDRTPFDAMTAGSRTTYSTNVALGEAVELVREELSRLASQQLEVAVADLRHEEGHVVVAGDPAARRAYGELLERAGIDRIRRDGVFQSEGDAFADPGNVRGRASIHWHQGAVAAEVDVDLETGKIEIVRCHGASYAGRVVNPTRVRQQNEGSIIFGIGPTLFEELLFDGGQVVNPNLSDYMIPSIIDVPLRLTSTAVEHPEQEGAELHGVGEMTIPAVSPAIANAVYRAAGVRLRDLPLSPERVLRALRGVEEEG